jgi:ubiquinone/menaquinone biosynthesis C-methylase UbiE
MIDLADLTPAERARQLGRPEGEVGSAIAERLNAVNRGVNEAVFRRLGLKRGHWVLEVGFGNGRLLPVLMRQAEDIRYAGIDISGTMVEEASRHNHALVAAGHAAFHHAPAEAIPLPDGAFDRAFAVAVVYFWAEPVKALAEVRRVLRPGGVSIVASLRPETAASMDFARPEFGFRVRDEGTLVGMHREAGFRRVVAEPYEQVVMRPDGSTWPLRGFLVVAET